MPVPDNATALDQLIAFTGRNPAMTSANTIKRIIDVDGAVLHADTRWGAGRFMIKQNSRRRKRLRV